MFITTVHSKDTPKLRNKAAAGYLVAVLNEDMGLVGQKSQDATGLPRQHTQEQQIQTCRWPMRGSEPRRGCGDTRTRKRRGVNTLRCSQAEATPHALQADQCAEKRLRTEAVLRVPYKPCKRSVGSGGGETSADLCSVPRPLKRGAPPWPGPAPAPKEENGDRMREKHKKGRTLEGPGERAPWASPATGRRGEARARRLPASSRAAARPHRAGPPRPGRKTWRPRGGRDQREAGLLPLEARVGTALSREEGSQSRAYPLNCSVAAGGQCLVVLRGNNFSPESTCRLQ